MRVSWTLSIYLGRHFLHGIVLALAVLSALILLIEVVELLRRSADRPEVTFLIVLGLALLNLPTVLQKILPFAFLFGGMYAFLRLTKTHELIVARAAGVSVWQFLLPALIIAVALGAFVIAVVNPLAAVMASRHDNLEAKYLHGRSSLLAVSSSGLWLRQADPGGRSVIHAQSVSQQGTEFRDVVIFRYEGSGDRFVERLDARLAELSEGHWRLRDAILSSPDRPARTVAHSELPTNLTLKEIQDSFAAPETLSFWALPAFIELLQEAGFAARRYRVHWHSVLSLPFFLAATVLIAATFSLRLTRRGATGLLVAGGAATGFALFVVSDLVLALGMSGKVPPLAAAWTPVGVTALLGLALLLHFEDG
ncbi:MAG: LPS export ABC transporter permease LptG [Alphaproteobacteria bacterium]|nr:LPS export ABC transporter permease LptG [Alphaproteobacteria bacterium]